MFRYTNYQTEIIFSDNPTTAEIDLTFEGALFTSEYRNKIMLHFEQHLPISQYGSYYGYVLGNLIIYHSDVPVITKVPMTFEALNMPWSANLKNNKSNEFRALADPLCQDVRKLH